MKIQINALKPGDHFQNRRGAQFTVLAIEEKERVSRPPGVRYTVRIEDYQLDRDYDVHYMGTDEVEKIDRPRKLARERGPVRREEY